MIVLGIDTSCDDTSVGIVRDTTVLANVVSSQDAIHAEWGGVVPNLAKRAHQENFSVVYQQALQEAEIEENEIDVIAVTYGHGLAIALEVGILEAKKLAARLEKPLIAINHSEGHILANCANDLEGHGGIPLEELPFPALCILVAGGQTQLIRMQSFGKYEMLGQTLDDAIGEGFDKAARLLGLPYPGGAKLSELAATGNPIVFTLPRPMRGSGDLNMSYAGLKTAFLHLVNRVKLEFGTLTDKQRADLAASYQHAALDSLLIKIEKALQSDTYGQILLGGGVAANPVLQQRLLSLGEKYQVPVHIPFSRKLCTDNGAMIAIAGYFHALQNDFVQNLEILERDPRLSLTA
jgi:N6-L-threonylcarbamoyladenine synthase